MKSAALPTNHGLFDSGNINERRRVLSDCLRHPIVKVLALICLSIQRLRFRRGIMLNTELAGILPAASDKSGLLATHLHFRQSS